MSSDNRALLFPSLSIQHWQGLFPISPLRCPAAGGSSSASATRYQQNHWCFWKHWFDFLSLNHFLISTLFPLCCHCESKGKQTSRLQHIFDLLNYKRAGLDNSGHFPCCFIQIELSMVLKQHNVWRQCVSANNVVLLLFHQKIKKTEQRKQQVGGLSPLKTPCGCAIAQHATTYKHSKRICSGCTHQNDSCLHFCCETVFELCKYHHI